MSELTSTIGRQDILDKLKPYEDTITVSDKRVISLDSTLGDGNTDVTEEIQGYLDEIKNAGGGVLYIPTGNYMIKVTSATTEEEATIPWQSKDGLKIGSNTTLLFADGAKFTAIPNASWNYVMLNIDRASYVNIIGAELVGDRDKHDPKYTKSWRGTPNYDGETGWGIITVGAHNVNIIHNYIHDFWGDAIDLYGDKTSGNNTNINIQYNLIDNNRRQGISIENVDGATVDHNLIENTHGTAPQVGIDIEPSDFADLTMRVANNVTVTNNYFKDNNSAGLMTYALNASAEGFENGPATIENLIVKNNTFDGNNTNSQNFNDKQGWNWQQNMNGQLALLGTLNATVENNKLINPNPKGLTLTETNGNVGQVIDANTYPTAGMYVGYNSGINVHNNYLQGQDIFVTGYQSPYYRYHDATGLVSRNYANKVITNGTLPDNVAAITVPANSNSLDTSASKELIQSLGVQLDTVGNTVGLNKIPAKSLSDQEQQIVNMVKAYQVTPITNKIINVHDRGIIGDGTTDQRKALQSILDEIDQASGGIIYLPAGTYMVDSISQDSKYSDPHSLLVPTAVQGLQMHSNTTLLMDKDASLKAIPNKYWNYLVLNALHVENVNVLGGSIIGDRPNHDMSNPNMTWNNSKGFNSPYYGEWGTGFSSSHSNHVNVFNVHFKDFWGDGISLFAENAEANSGAESQANNIHISYCTFNHNRRQGISVGHANNVEIDHSIFANTNGTGPGAGIDLEPGGGSTEIVENINIHDNVFINNNNAGITAYAASKSHVRNIHIYNNTFVDNSAWIPGQLVTNQVEGVEIDHNKFINNEASRWHSMWIMSTSNMNIHDNYGQNSAIDISSDNPASGFPSPSGSVHDNYISYVVIEHTGIQSSNNKLPDDLSVNSINNYGAHLSYTRDTNDSEVLTTNEKVTFTGFNSHGTPLNVTDNPDSTVLNFWDTISWTADISFDIDAKYLNNKGDSDNTIRYSTPLWSMVHVPDYTPAIGSSDLLLGNAGVPVTIDGIKVAQMYANYMVSTGNFKGSGIQHVTVHGVNFGDGTWKNKPGTKTIITTADGKKYGYTFKNSDGTLPNVINNQLISTDNINPTPDENPFTITPSAPSTPSSSTPPKPVEPAKYNLTISLIDRDSSQVKTNYKITKTEGEPITITLGMVESLLPQHYTFVPHALDNFPQTITLNGDSDTTVFITPIIDTINNTKQVTRTIIGQWFDTNGNIISSSTLKVQTAEFTTPTYVNEVTGQRTIGNSSPDNTTFPAYAIPPTKGYTAETAEVSSLTVFSTSNDTLVTVKYNKNRPPIVVEPPKPTTITNNFTVSVALPKLDKQTAFSISIKGSGVLHQISNADHTKLVTYDFNLNPNWYQRVEFMLDKQDAQNLELTFQNVTDSVYLKLPKLEYGSTSTPYSE